MALPLSVLSLLGLDLHNDPVDMIFGALPSPGFFLLTFVATAAAAVDCRRHKIIGRILRRNY